MMHLGTMRATAQRYVGPWAALLINAGLRLTHLKAGVALVYHTVDTRPGDPVRELVPAMDRDRFASQIHHLRRFYDVVAVDDYLAAVARRRRGERFPVCLTLDDDSREHLEHAVPILRAQGATATFFLCGASLARPRSLWWERLQRAFDGGTTEGDVERLLPTSRLDRLAGTAPDIHRIGEAIEALAPQERDAVAHRLLSLAGPDPPDAGLDAQAVSALVRDGFGIGFHTRRHDTLTQLDDAELRRVMEEGRGDLAELAGRPIDSLAYPHGSADSRVADAAARAGFRLGFTTTRCAVGIAADPLLLGRYDPTRVSGGAFALGTVRTLMTRPAAIGPMAAS